MALRTKAFYKTRQVKAYIEEQPLDLVLVRKIRVPTPGGTGYRETDATLAPQRVRLNDVPSARQATRQSSAGQVTRIDGELIGMPDLDVQAGDTFTTDEGKWLVVHVGTNQSVRTVVDVEFLGR